MSVTGQYCSSLFRQGILYKVMQHHMVHRLMEHVKTIQVELIIQGEEREEKLHLVKDII